MFGLKGYLYVGVAVAAIGTLTYWTMWHRNDAADDVVNEIERLNEEIENEAVDARDARRRCFDAGGLYDFATGKCRELEERGGD